MSQANVEVVQRFIGWLGDLAPSEMLRLASDFYEPDADFYPVLRKVGRPRDPAS